jgi:flagellar assembly protein FliH
MFDEGAEAALKKQNETLLRKQENDLAEDPPTFSEADLNSAKEIAFKQGIQEGKAEIMAGIEREISATLDTIALKIDILINGHKKWSDSITEETIKFAHAIMKKLAPQLAQGSELPEIENAIKNALSFLNKQPKVTVQISNNLRQPLQEKILLMSSRTGFEGEIVLVDDPNIATGDCKLNWDSGEMERSISNTWKQIDSIIERVIVNADTPLLDKSLLDLEQKKSG